MDQLQNQVLLSLCSQFLQSVFILTHYIMSFD